MEKIKRDDVIERVFFITKLVQNQSSNTMQGAFTSKSDSMGGIFDRFINTVSDSLVFEKIIFPKLKTDKEVHVINDYYFYNPNKSVSGIAPDVFGITVNGKPIRFTKFENKWKAEKKMPQIEVKTFKAKDQMITLRNQEEYQYIIFVDLDLRKDYLVPFFDKKILNNNFVDKMQMPDGLFIEEDKKSKIKKVTPIDYSSDDIGSMDLIAITNADDFMKQATFCPGRISVRRMKEIRKLQINAKSGLIHEKLSKYAQKSPRIEQLYEFNSLWRKVTGVGKNTEMLDFSADNIENIEICKFSKHKDAITITALEEGCSFNGMSLEVGKQYSVKFATLDRSENYGSEHFMQKQCAYYLTGIEKKLIKELETIINNN